MSDFTFSEHGEDILIHRLLLWRERGFYLDCGAYHPRSMSMTARLRLFGWRGVNVDIDSTVVEGLQQDIPGDISVCAALDEADGVEVDFFKYEDAVLNTILPAQHAHLQRIERSNELFTSFVSSERVRTTSLRSLIRQHASGEKIDFVNLDLEGVELNVLRGFPWEEHTPSVFSIEIHGLDTSRFCENDIVQFMVDHGYRLQSYVFHTAIFCRADFDTELCHRVSAKRI